MGKNFVILKVLTSAVKFTCEYVNYDICVAT